MCGRYTLTNPHQLPLRFDVAAESTASLAPRYNVAPSQDLPVIVEQASGRGLQVMRWGFQPAWITSPKAPAPINARAETLLERSMFRGALARHRCLIPADGFYEWQQQPGRRTKQPLYARLQDGSLFAFAGLYTAGQGDRPASCTIITTAPNDRMAPIHHRMPVILEREDEPTWLDPELTEPHAVLGLLRPYPPERMQVYPVGLLVSSVRNDGPALIQPLA